MSNATRYVIPKTNAVIELTKVVVLVRTCLQNTLSKTIATRIPPKTPVLKESDELVFSIPGRDGITALLDETVDYFLDKLEESINDNMEFLEIAWRKNGFFIHNVGYDDENDRFNDPIEFNDFWNRPSIMDLDKEALNFLILMELVSGANMYQRYNRALENAFGQDVKNQDMQPIRCFNDTTIGYFLEDTIEALTKDANYQAICRIVTDFAISSLSPEMLDADDDEVMFITNWVINSVYYSTPSSNHSLFVKLDEDHIAMDENSVISLKSSIISMMRSAYVNATAMINLANPDILHRVNPLTFAPLIKIDDPYMSMYSIKPMVLIEHNCDASDWTLTRRENNIIPVMGIYQYVYIVTDDLSNAEKAEIWRELQLLIVKDTVNYVMKGVISLLWRDISVAMFNDGKRMREILQKMPRFLCSNVSKQVSPLSSRYSLLNNPFLGKSMQNSYRVFRIGVGEGKNCIHYDVYRMMDLLSTVQTANLCSRNLCSRDTSVIPRDPDGTILIYTVLYMSPDFGVKLTQTDIIDLIDFCFAVMKDSAFGYILQMNMLNVVNGSVPSNQIVTSEVGALYLANNIKLFFDLLIWLSKTTVYKAAEILSWMVRTKTDVSEIIELSVDDVITMMLSGR